MQATHSELHSQYMEHELLSVAAADDGTIFCGSGENMIEIFQHSCRFVPL